MLAWLMNLGFGAGGRSQPAPPVTPPVQGGGGHRRERRGSIWEPRVELAILEAQHRRALETFAAQETVIKKQLARPVTKRLPLTPVQQQQVREGIRRLAGARKQAQTDLNEVLARILELDREIAEQQASAAKTLRELEAASVAAALEHKARQAAEVERRVARETELAAARRAAARVEAARVEAARVAEIARQAAALEARKRDEEAIAMALWMAMFDE